MSKLNEYAIELDEQAGEMGFESLQQALQAGCEVEYGENTVELLDPLEAAHRAFESEKVVLVKGLDRVMDRMGNGIEPEDIDLIEHAKKFIQEARF